MAQPLWVNAMAVKPLRLAIGTLVFGTKLCPLGLWCQAARKLRWTLQAPWHVQLVIVWLPPQEGELGLPRQHVVRPSAFCAEAEIIYADRTLLAEGSRCLKQGRRAGYNTKMPLEIMLKYQRPTTNPLPHPSSSLSPSPLTLDPGTRRWQFVGMTQFDAVLFLDHDTDMMPREVLPERLRARWQQMLPLFLMPRGKLRIDGNKSAGLRVLASADACSPVNTGVMLIKPSRWLYRDGVSVLSACTVNQTHGWGLVGKPRGLHLRPRYFSATAGGSTTARPQRVDRESGLYFPDPSLTNAHTFNSWDFVAAAEDQARRTRVHTHLHAREPMIVLHAQRAHIVCIQGGPRRPPRTPRGRARDRPLPPAPLPAPTQSRRRPARRATRAPCPHSSCPPPRRPWPPPCAAWGWGSPQGSSGAMLWLCALNICELTPAHGPFLLTGFFLVHVLHPPRPWRLL